MKKHHLVYVIAISVMLLVIVGLFLVLLLRKSPKCNSTEQYNFSEDR